MVQTFVFIFYMALNIVPSKTTQFNIEMHNPKDAKEVVVLDFKKQKDYWTVGPKDKPKDRLLFRFDKDNVCYIKETETGKEEKVKLLSETEITPNHKKWKKVTKIEFKSREKASRTLIFNITKKGKKGRVIALDKSMKPEMSRMMPKMEISWK